eukprot:Hpha_TRINITY_DN92_c0_g1::TRINITY_DN92_c0_g1_i1::g.110204::m.110204
MPGAATLYSSPRMGPADASGEGSVAEEPPRRYRRVPRVAGRSTRRARRSVDPETGQRHLPQREEGRRRCCPARCSLPGLMLVVVVLWGLGWTIPAASLLEVAEGYSQPVVRKLRPVYEGVAIAAGYADPSRRDGSRDGTGSGSDTFEIVAAAAPLAPPPVAPQPPKRRASRAPGPARSALQKLEAVHRATTSALARLRGNRTEAAAEAEDILSELLDGSHWDPLQLWELNEKELKAELIPTPAPTPEPTP